MSARPVVWVRGAGELGSATALTLHRVGFPVLLSELERPLAIRRTVTFSDAVFEGRAEVEGVSALRTTPDRAAQAGSQGAIALVYDDPGRIVAEAAPVAVVDARMIKRAEDLRGLAPLQVAMGPGCEAGVHCDAVVETKRGHTLGRVVWSGPAAPDTGVPGKLGGRSVGRVIYSPTEGEIRWRARFGEIVEEGQVIGTVGGAEVRAPFRGMVRGMISPRVTAWKGLKIGDVDPRGEEVDPYLVSDKARSVARASLEALLMLLRSGEGER